MSNEEEAFVDDGDDADEEYSETNEYGKVTKLHSLDSNSEGVFYIPKVASSLNDSEINYFESFRGESLDKSRWRKVVSDYTANIVIEQITKSNQALQEKNISAIVSYVSNEIDKTIDNVIEKPPKEFYHDVVSETISTAVVFAGMNVQDHEELFNSLAKRLEGVTSKKYNVKPKVTLLFSKQCPTFQTTKKELLLQSLPRQIRHRSKWDISDLAAWYREKRSKFIQYHQRKSASTEENEEYQHLVVLIADFDFFQSEIIQDLISVCSTHQRNLRVTFIFGIAKNISLGEALPKWTTSLLRIERLSLQVSTELLFDVIDLLAIRGGARNATEESDGAECEGGSLIRLGMKALDFIISNFKHNDYSCRTLLRIYAFAIVQHFYYQPLSIMSFNFNDKTMEGSYGTDDLTPDVYQKILALPSVRRHKRDLKDELALKGFTEDGVQLLDLYHKRYPGAFGCYMATLSLIYKGVNPKSKSKRVMEYLELHANPQIKFQEILKELLKQTRANVTELLKKWAIILSRLRNLFSNALVTIEYLLKLTESNHGSIPKPSNAECYLEGGDDNNIGDMNNRQVAPSSRLMRKKALEEACVNPESRKNDAIKVQMVQFIFGFVDTHLLAYNSYPMYEVFYYDNEVRLATAFNPSIKNTIHRALSDPYCYLSCNCCAQSHDSTISSMPDICIVYKLIEKTGKMINLFDLYSAFRQITLSGEATSKNEHQMQGRMLRAVKELRFMGLIKETSRKQDHIVRVVFSLAV